MSKSFDKSLPRTTTMHDPDPAVYRAADAASVLLMVHLSLSATYHHVRPLDQTKFCQTRLKADTATQAESAIRSSVL